MRISDWSSFFFKQKTAYELRISDCSSDVCSSDLLIAATDVHRLLQALLGLPVPVYRHHALVCGPDGRRLAKRDAAAALGALRDGGIDGHALDRKSVV